MKKAQNDPRMFNKVHLIETMGFNTPDIVLLRVIIRRSPLSVFRAESETKKQNSGTAGVLFSWKFIDEEVEEEEEESDYQKGLQESDAANPLQSPTP